MTINGYKVERADDGDIMAWEVTKRGKLAGRITLHLLRLSAVAYIRGQLRFVCYVSCPSKAEAELEAKLQEAVDAIDQARRNWR